MEIVGQGPGFATPRYVEAAIAVELDDRRQVDEAYHRLVAAGVRASAPTLQCWRHYSTSLRDPVELEVVLYADEREVADQHGTRAGRHFGR